MPPVRSRYDVVCISSIDWEFIWQGHQEIMAAFATRGHRVLFIENTGVRAPKFRDLPRVGRRVRNWLRGVNGFRQERPNLFVYSPLVLPFPYLRLAGWINRALLMRGLRRWLRATRFGRPVVWTFLPTPLARHVIRELEPLLTIYYCIDDLASSSPAARRIAHSETLVLREADLVFVTSHKLRERASRFNENVHLFPFGVAYRRFEEARIRADEPPDDVRALPRPLVGYVGGLHRWVDQDLLMEAARAIPDATFVLVGPSQVDTSRLARTRNIQLLGARAHADVPRYIKTFDVAIVPYRLSDYTANVYPTKLNEYLAMGVPVVATDLPEIRHFNADHGDVVTIGADATAFVDGVRQALRSNSSAEVKRRIDVAQQNGWESRITRMWEVIEAALDQREHAGERWEDTLRRLYWHARRRLAGTTAAAVLAYMALFYTPLVWFLAEPLRVVDTPRPADIIVVFAGGVGESGKAGGGYQERVKQAVDLYRGGLAPRMVFSSGYTAVFREASVMRDLAMSLGVPAPVISLETKAGNTYENVLYTRDIVRQQGARRVLLVSSPYHMRRAVSTWHKQAPDIDVVSAPPPYSQFYRHAWGASFDQIRGVVQEYGAIVLYWWKGWL